MQKLAQLRQSIEALFPERHLYIRSGGEMRGFVLSTQKQMMVAGGVAGCALWMGVSTAAMLVGALSASSADRELARTQAKYERWIADRQARLNAAVAQLNAGGGTAQEVAATVEKRHAALALLLSDAKGAPGAAQALTPAIDRALRSDDPDPVKRVERVHASQEELLEAADDFASKQAERAKLAFRMAGLKPSSYMPKSGPLGGPLIESQDPRALAAVLDVDPGFAKRVQNAAGDLAEARALSEAARALPFSKPAETAPQTSSYGFRFDPFTKRPAFHSGLDFAGAMMAPVYATAPGVVSFTGVRSGYGNTIEVDHGRGFKTRYAHLAKISVRPGQRVGLGQRLGGIGSTGRSTGPHLHYEVWLNGRAQNPERFIKAGSHVLKAG
jgi:murein DD-endopeptidase MepM/ murein hydrolase activator NlpD